jgi:hypothetical protein
MDKTILSHEELHALFTRLEAKFPHSRVWFEPFPGRVSIQYGGGLFERLTVTQARARLG